MLNNKNIKKIQYEIDPKDITKIYYKDKNFKHYSLDIYERKTQEKQVKETTKHIEEFKNNIKKLKPDKYDQSWIDNFFNKVIKPD